MVLVTLVFSSCDGIRDKRAQGVITYKLTYPKMDKSSFMVDFMPTTMKMKFHADKYITTLSAGMGMFKTSFIFDQSEKSFSQLVKLIDKKYVFRLQQKEVETMLGKMPTFTVEHSDEVKTIAGYKCNKAIITVNDGSNDAFSVFYTDEIHIQSPNWCTQFKDIEGVMLEYQYEKYGVCTRLSAESVVFEKVEDAVFEIPENYVFVKQEVMDKEMEDIFNSFK